MERSIVGFALDDDGEWVAALSCFHRQHVRHNPPFRMAPWVLDDGARAERVGAAWECPLCDRAELPEGLAMVRVTETWDEQTVPAGLRRAHRVAAGTWARLHVEQGEIRFQARTDPAIDVVLGAGSAQAIPPDVEHEVDLRGGARFFLEFLRPVKAAAGD